MRARRTTATIVVLGLTAVLAACGPARHKPSAAPALTPLPAAQHTGNPVVYSADGAELLADGTPILPLDGYDAYAHPDDATLIADAATHVEKHCMSVKGLSLPADEGGLYLPTPAPTLAYYGVTTVAQAADTGYRLPPAAPSAPDSIVEPNAMPTATREAFLGQSGCAGAAYNALGMRRADDAYSFIQQLRDQALTATIADPALKAADSAWSTCMTAAGYQYSDPLAPGHDRTMLGRGLPVPAGAALAPVSPYERAVAAADVACKQKTGYLRIYVRTAADRQNRLILANQTRLRTVLEEWRGVLADARGHTA